MKYRINNAIHSVGEDKVVTREIFPSINAAKRANRGNMTPAPEKLKRKLGNKIWKKGEA